MQAEGCLYPIIQLIQLSADSYQLNLLIEESQASDFFNNISSHIKIISCILSRSLFDVVNIKTILPCSLGPVRNSFKSCIPSILGIFKSSSKMNRLESLVRPFQPLMFQMLFVRHTYGI